MQQPNPAGRHRARWLLVLAVATVWGAVSVPGAQASGGSDPAPGTVYSSPDRARPLVDPQAAGVTVTGHGFGHGIGLSQYGAYGYAIDHGWSSSQILQHYYGNTTTGTIADDDVTVRLVAHDGKQTNVVTVSGAATSADGYAGSWKTVVIRPASSGVARYDVWARADAMTCVDGAAGLDPGAGWVSLATGIVGPVDVALAGEAPGTARADLPALCEPSGTIRSYRGTLRAMTGTDNSYHTVSVLPMEQYLRGVVSSEVSASWGNSGGGKGMAALEAQAVAARSYAARESRYSYAKTCDTQSCQVYGGAARRTSLTGSLTAVEQVNTDAAIVSTAGVVRRMPDGSVANTMFSASSGGYTVGGDFPAVVDLGDSVSANPYHDWTKVVSVASIEARWASIGSLTGISVLERTGAGADGGRVVRLVVSGTSGSQTMSGDAFRLAFGLRSNWFSIAGIGGSGNGGSGGSSPDSGDGGSSDGGSSKQPVDACRGRNEPSIAPGSVPDPGGVLTGITPVVPVRVVDTRVGLGTTKAALDAGCTLSFDPGAPPDGATAAVLVLTTTGASRSGFTTAYPCGRARPDVSAVQILAGKDIPGTTVVPLGSDGSICIYSAVTTHVVVDVMGWLTPSGAAFRGIGRPERLLDTRLPVPQPIIRAGQRQRVFVTPTSADAPVAASVNLTVTGAVASGYLTAWPCGPDRPETSVLNFRRQEDIANHVFVTLDDEGAFCLWSSADVHMIADLDGVFSDDPAAERLEIVGAQRPIDTRRVGSSGVLKAGTTRALALGEASNGLLAEVTVVDPAASGYLSLFPCGEAGAGSRTSVINAPRGANVANLILMSTDADGRLCAYVTMDTNLLIDVIGRSRP